MPGIVFYKTKRLKAIKSFYLDQLGCDLWLDQGECLIFRHGNLLLGFCQRDRADTEGTICFVCRDVAAVNEAFRRLKPITLSLPSVNPRFDIFHFYAEDPEGRMLEFQCFNKPVDFDFDKACDAVRER